MTHTKAVFEEWKCRRCVPIWDSFRKRELGGGGCGNNAWMNSGRSVFAQLIEHLLHEEFHKYVARYRGNRYAKNFSCRGSFVSDVKYGVVEAAEATPSSRPSRS